MDAKNLIINQHQHTDKKLNVYLLIQNGDVCKSNLVSKAKHKNTRKHRDTLSLHLGSFKTFPYLGDLKDEKYLIDCG